jgi:NAD(P)-dependent dehydrogenase (short-subunit alcohol dehydrogenase family)
MDLGLKGKLALVTGSTLGIGRAIAEMLVSEGARVIVNGRRENAVREAVAALSRRGEAHGIAADLMTAEGAQKIAEGAARIGQVDILVNNAGFFEVKAFADITDRDWLSMFELNVMSGVRLTRALFPGMLTKGTAVTVNSVLVAPTWSEGVEVFLEKMAADSGREVGEMRTAYFEGPGSDSLLQRWATPAEIAAQVAFLCSERASAINGAAQRVDGGIVRSLF